MKKYFLKISKKIQIFMMNQLKKIFFIINLFKIQKMILKIFLNYFFYFDLIFNLFFFFGKKHLFSPLIHLEFLMPPQYHPLCQYVFSKVEKIHDFNLKKQLLNLRWPLILDCKLTILGL